MNVVMHMLVLHWELIIFVLKPQALTWQTPAQVLCHMRECSP